MRLLVIATGLLCLTWAEPAFACTCTTGNPIAAQYRQFLKGFDGAVFRGTVVESTLEGDSPRLVGRVQKVTFKVERHWQGVTSAEVAVYTSATMCAAEFVPGLTYTVVAEWANGRLSSHLCLQKTATMNEAAFHEALGEGSPPPTQSPR